MSNASDIRLEKILSERGVAARRKAAEIIAAGRVTVDGAIVTEPGARADPMRARIAVDGSPLPPERPAVRLIALHKPRGYVCSRSPRQGRTVYELLGSAEQSLLPVGRLDKDSEGLLLMTNDGALMQRLTHPRHGQAKTYRVTVSGALDAAALQRLRGPMDIDGYRLRPVDVDYVKAAEKPGRHILRFRLREGRNRQIRKMCNAAGLHVHRLVRIEMAGVALTGLQAGKWREIQPAALQAT